MKTEGLQRGNNDYKHMHSWESLGRCGGLVQDITAAPGGYGTGTRGEGRKLSKTVAEIEPFSQSASPEL